MIFKIITRRWKALLERLVAATASPEHGRRVLIFILIAYSAVWTAYAIIAKSTQGIHADMAEVFSWSWDLEWGTHKHPPLLPALVSLWFSIFPVSDWAYYLLAVTSTAIAIYFTWLLSGFWLQGAKRAAVPFFLMLIPFYNFLALKLDHNVILVPLWAITTYAFVRSFQTRSILWSVVTGVFAGLAVLAKYWSFFLLLGLAIAALADSRRLRYLKSWSPWIITVVSFGLFLPHIAWLEANHYPTFIAAQNRLANSSAETVWYLWGYVYSSIAYVAGPLLAVALLAKPSRSALIDILFPRDRERRFAAVMFWVPLLAAIPFAIFMQVRLTSLWTMSALSLLGVVLLSSPLVDFTRKSAAVVVGTVIVVSIAALLASPLVAIEKLHGGVENHAAYTRAVAKEVQKQWEQTTTQPLHIVGSVFSLANSVAFYLKQKALPVTFYARTRPSWDTAETIDQFGAALICPAASVVCRSTMTGIVAGRPVARHAEVTVQPHWLGFFGDPRGFVIDIVLPQIRNQAAEEFCCVSAAKRTKTTDR
jgi:4-amino-4-deoxy-L-arabinose transferase-like glycosyltransferase